MTSESTDEIETALNSEGLSVRDLHGIWEQWCAPVADSLGAGIEGDGHQCTGKIPWLTQNSLSVARLFIQRALEKQEFLLAYDAAREALKLRPLAHASALTELVQVRIQYATALTRLGFAADARRELDALLADGSQPLLSPSLETDILLQLGNILREDSQHASSRAEWRQSAEEALGFYERALLVEPERLDALALAAAAGFVLGEPGSRLRDEAAARAETILSRTTAAEKADGGKFSTTLFRGVARAVRGDTDGATAEFKQLEGLKDSSVGRLAGARFWVQGLAQGAGLPLDYFKPAFPPLQLIVFCGDLPDHPGHDGVFPFSSIDAMRKTLEAELRKARATVALVGAAAGADLLFIEALRSLGGEVHVILPWSQEQFRRTSVRPFEPDPAAPFWEPQFDRALLEAASVREIGQLYSPGSDVGWRYVTEVIAGAALHQARMSRLDVLPMAIRDETAGRGTGETGAFIELWSGQVRLKPVILNLPDRQADLSAAPAGPIPAVRSESRILRHQVKSMLFADIVGYSKLTEEVIPEFVEVFMHKVSCLVSSSRHAPCSINTWGDAVYGVFDFAHDAGCFALELTRMIKEGEREWLGKGLYWEEEQDGGKPPVKHPLNIRVGLHTGPVFLHYNPVLRQLGHTGVHVSRAARIEPVAQPGEVYASEEFAALVELEKEIRRHGEGANQGAGGGDFACEYAGTMPLAKGYPGRHRIYRLVPRRLLAIEELAQAVHKHYCSEAVLRGETRQTNSSLLEWDELPEDLREANRAQAADVPAKLRILGYELTPGHGLPPSAIVISDAQCEQLAIREHKRWMQDRQRLGWTYAPIRDNARKHHPLLVPWEELSDIEKEKDRDTVRNLPRLIEKTGFRVRRIGS